ncbi:Cuticle Protein CPR RR Uncl [Hyalella azteca]|nr:Cuticle Protein CPR RR Uncl [Hyalella azteca]
MVTVMMVMMTAAAPQNNNNRGRPTGGAQPLMEYKFDWQVDDAESGSYYGHREGTDGARVVGSHYVWLPDGRLRRVDYYVDADSGYVPTITYINNYTPSWGQRPYRR